MQTTFEKKSFLKQLTHRPGIYQMLSEAGTVLYVGKARDLKKRLTNYFQKNVDQKTAALMRHVVDIQVTLTQNENEALILEYQFIKEHRPHYNIIFRDDKSYPYIHLSDHTHFPRLEIVRGRKQRTGQYFGPFPNASAVHDTLQLIQKIFRIRNCSDSFFKNRQRPCLQYQINRCTAPCVNLIDEKKYQNHVRQAVMLLEGKNQDIIDELSAHMDAAARTLQYELATQYRDQISAIRELQQKQCVSGKKGNADVLSLVVQAGMACVHMLHIRRGCVLGSRPFFPRMPAYCTPSDIMYAFVTQYYLNDSVSSTLPTHIIVNTPLQEKMTLEALLSEKAGFRIQFLRPVRGERKQWQQMATDSATQALSKQLTDTAHEHERWAALQNALALTQSIQRIECFDISHHAGEATVASCVVFNHEGPMKSFYRRFNITNITPGDDYAAIYQALMHRYKNQHKNDKQLPDLILIDGGKGQLKKAKEGLEALGLSGIAIIGIAKGRARKPGEETFYDLNRLSPLRLPSDSLALHLLQHIRDETHRFAITGHRGRRDRKRRHSILESIPGIGPKRRQQLLRHFGGLQGLKRASVLQLTEVGQINQALAQRIYDALQ